MWFRARNNCCRISRIVCARRDWRLEIPSLSRFDRVIAIRRQRAADILSAEQVRLNARLKNPEYHIENSAGRMPTAHY
jgi:hypothetical protein